MSLIEALLIVLAIAAVARLIPDRSPRRRVPPRELRSVRRAIQGLDRDARDLCQHAGLRYSEAPNAEMGFSIRRIRKLAEHWERIEKKYFW